MRFAKVEAPPTAPKISAVAEAAPALTLLGGLNGQFMIEEITRGARGQMPAADMTAIYVEIWDHLPQIAAALHIASATANCPLVEYNPKVLDVANRYLQEPIRTQGATYALPPGPGLGAAVRDTANIED